MKKPRTKGPTMPQELTARHTGNAGILLYEKERNDKNNIGRNAIGIDVFCKDRKGLYQDTPEEEKRLLFARIERGELGTLIFTHEHGDHFCLEDVLEALQRNPALRIISTAAVIGKIRAAGGAGVLTEIPPQEKGMVRISLPDPGAELFLFNSPHMGEQFSEVQNLVCLLKMGGRCLMIPGDARPDAALFECAAACWPALDWLIAPFPVLGLPSSRKKIAASLTVRRALAVHLPRPEKDLHGWRISAVKVCERAKDGLPMPLFGDVIGEEYEL